MMFSSCKCIFVQFLESGKEPAVRGPRVGGFRKPVASSTPVVVID